MKRLFVVLLTALTLFSAGLSAALAQSTTAYTSETLPFDPSTSTRSTGFSTSTLLDLGRRDPVSVAIAYINGLLTLLGFGFLILLLYAGVIWILARGNEEEITRAKTILQRALVGLAIVLGAYGISYLTFITIDAYVSTTT